MMSAYQELYLSNAKTHLATMFDYAINTCGFEADFFADLFTMSKVASLIEEGNPHYLVGLSGQELVERVVAECFAQKKLPTAQFVQARSKEYWAGWALAQYQWQYKRRFRRIFEKIALSKIIALYPLYHEMDITHFYQKIEECFATVQTESKLKQLRKSAGLSQSALANLADTNIRNIQMYEQKHNDIDKAEARTLYKIARALHCSIEDLLENCV